MNRCPFCKAEIEEQARFCLYCMKPLNQKETPPPLQKKKQWWPFVLLAVILVAVPVAILLWGNGQSPAPAEKETTQTTLQTEDTPETEIPDIQTGKTEQENIPQQEVVSPNTPQTNQGDTNDTPAPPENTSPEPDPIQPETPTQDPVPPAGETPDPEITPDESPDDPVAPEIPTSQVVYTYRAAHAGDEFNAQYQNTGNDIVITGISVPAENGVYDIPAYIDGKKVIAIVANAFTGSNAKIVYLPDTVRNIWNYAFYSCPLTDIYFRSNAIYAERNAFSGSLTIHCSATCSDRNFYYYKNTAPSYGAVWAEWNG